MGFTVPSSTQLRSTLAQRLIPVADRLRDLNTRFGLRPYAVSLVKVRWTDGERGAGERLEIFRQLLEPTPKVSPITELNEILEPIGLEEQGNVRLSEISGTMTEDQLRGLDPNGATVGPDESFFYEIVFLASGPTPLQRWFVLKSPPNFNAGRLMWTVTLKRSAPSDPERPGEVPV